jgi:hypothetical protein
MGGVGSETIMHEQLSYLAERALLQHVGLQVVPAVSGANAGCVGALTIASVDGAPDVLLTEAVEDATTENRSMVRKGLDIFDRVRYDALPRAASLERIREAEPAGQASDSAPAKPATCKAFKDSGH